MQDYRETIIKRIIQSPDTLSVENVIDSSLQKLVENGTHPFIILRFIEKLKESLIGVKKSQASLKELDNTSQALSVLTNYDLKKVTVTNTKN